LKPTELKLKTCKVCHQKFAPRNTIQPVCFTFDCQVAYAAKHQKKVLALREKRERQALREAKERIKPRSKWLKDAQSVFNRFIRLRDATLPCISCGRFHTGQYHAGHYKPSGSNPELRFNELNVHKQCAPCNNYLSGNLVNYRVELVKRIGLEQVEWLEGKHELPHLSIQEIKQLIAKYKGKCKELLTKES
jgi:hypothetical protein